MAIKPTSRPVSPRQALGRVGEQLAAEKLLSLGYEIVARNQRTSEGEIDLITRQAGEWAFVEVRTRRGGSFGTPEESVTPRKQERMLRCALAYLAERELADEPWRVDVVAIEIDRQGKLGRVEVIPNAVRG